MDAFLKWPEICIQQQTTSLHTIARLRELFARFGVPSALVSDNGTQFTSNSFNEFYATNGVKVMHSPPYHPQSNGQAERFVDTFKRALLKSHGEELTPEALQTFLQCYRTTPNAALPNQSTPAEQMFGRKIRIQLDLMRPTTNTITIAKRNMKMESSFNDHHGAVKRIFHPGDKVYFMDYTTAKRSWSHGEILERCRTVLYNVSSSKCIQRRHANQLRILCNDSSSRNIPFEIRFNFVPKQQFKVYFWCKYRNNT